MGWRNWTPRARDPLIAALIALMVAIVYGISPVQQSTDSRFSLHVAQSIFLERNLDLDEFLDQGFISPDDYRIARIGGHAHSFFPIGASLLAVAPLALYQGARLVAGLGLATLSPALELRVASVLAALCSFVFYLICRRHLGRGKSLLLSLVFAFGTSAWSTASRALWQHGPSMLMLSLTLYLVLAAEQKPGWIVFAGLPLAFSYVVRPTNSVSVLCVSLFVLIRHRKYVLGFLGLAMVVAVPFVWFNWATWHSILPPYYLPERIGSNPAFVQALAGNWVSPSRGVLVFSPILLASIWGVVCSLREGGQRAVDVLLLVSVALHWVAVSSFPHWWGGHSFGPRFMSDMVPYMAYYLAPAVAWAARAKGRIRWAYAACLTGLALFSVFVHGRGATARSTLAWNREPTNVDRDQDRLWDWRDPQFARGLVPSIAARPDPLYVLRYPDSPSLDSVLALELVNLIKKPFRWRASAPAGIEMSALEGDDQIRYAVSVTVPWDTDVPGTYALGSVDIRFSAGGRLGWPVLTKSLPVTVRVVDRSHTLYLPLVVGDGKSF